MQNSKTSIFSNSLLWFGAAVSIAEILTGTLIAPLGLKQGISAILLGHVIGGALLYLAGLIGAKTGKSSMETVKLTFGKKGSIFFSSANVLQLLGWTAVMLASGAAAASAVFAIKDGDSLWCAIIALLLIFWVVLGINNVGKLNIVAVGGLFILTILLSILIFKDGNILPFEGNISFGAAVELSVAMPLSWLPLIADYTSKAQKPVKAAAVSSITYFFTSCWMYVIGLGAALFAGESDIAVIMLKSGLGIAALVIVILSTVTTTFLDVYSAGISMQSIFKRINQKLVSVVICLAAFFLALFSPVEHYEDFLYLISSVFAPMMAVMLADFFVLKEDNSKKDFSIKNLCLWLIGFTLYRLFMQWETPFGNTLPVMIIIFLLCLAVNKITFLCHKH